ncbi:potassium channel family protein [Metabacillus sp. GX 13764]|uniref:potassium channel family protein n=1 Tax=Metabacillus kandeliae TaxID=2900151 RepID=UPI001E454E83|nr:potassium channel family protein [Metabacillus kandeliae]MCD7035766.1 potassium channel family protein [Metabacillus kandeliae]
MKHNRLYTLLLKFPLSVRIGSTVILIIFIFAYLITLAEPKEFPDYYDGIWWAVVTIATVGYGDLVPVTAIGKLIGIILILLGAGFLTAYFAHLSAAAIQKQHSYSRGHVSFRSKDHLIVVGWNAKAREMIKTMRKTAPKRKVVLIDQSLYEAPLLDNIHFIKGNAAEDDVLLKANIHKADGIIITADQHKDEADSDRQTILTLLAVKGLNPGLYTICEILSEQSMNNAKRAGADEIIRTSEVTSHLMMNSLFSKKGLSDLFEKLNPAAGNHFEILAAGSMEGKSFLEASIYYLNQEKLLLGIKKGEETFLNPPHDYQISASEELILFVH